MGPKLDYSGEPLKSGNFSDKKHITQHKCLEI